MASAPRPQTLPANPGRLRFAIAIAGLTIQIREFFDTFACKSAKAAGTPTKRRSSREECPKARTACRLARLSPTRSDAPAAAEARPSATEQEAAAVQIGEYGPIFS
jgi:hypothetical protein